MSLRPYPNYKPSGVAWIGEVPADWRVVPLTNIAKVINGYPFDAGLFSPDGDYPLVRIRDLGKTDTESRYGGDFIAAAAVTSEDVLIGMDGDFNVGRWMGAGEALLNQRLCCVRGLTPAITRLLEYALVQPLKAINDVTYSTTVKHLSSLDVKKVRVPLPSQERELLTLVEFLDRETGKIDALVEEQKQLIELLKEKRQAVISHAVTKGLDPNAPMKPSGVEWLGDVPEHWEVKRLGHIASELQTGPFGSQLHSHDYIEGGTPVINPSNLQGGKIVPDWSNTVGSALADQLNHHRLREGDIVFGRRGEMGRCALVTDDAEGWLCGTGSLRVTLKQASMAEFITIFFQTPAVASYLQLVSVGSTMDNLNTSILAQVPIPIPPTDEAISIVGQLHCELERLGDLMVEAETAMLLLQERRSALVSAAVTGKIDVRAAKDAEEKVG